MANAKNVLQSIREDDFIEYFLFPPLNSTDPKEQDTLLQKYSNQINTIIEPHLVQYLWHKDGFKLTRRTSLTDKLAPEDTSDLLPHFHGITHFGDNLDDEWFIVFILQQITKHVEGIIARVVDADGEFILIEAAEYLPQWANPDTCSNRVYITQGNIHIIPLLDEENNITINQAVKTIRNDPSKTLAGVHVQNSILHKVNDYPAKILKNFHHATAYLPVGVAAVLQNNPALIAPAILAFCNRDPIDVKICKAMKFFPPENRVRTRIKFTKHLYAMITHSKYMPESKIGWNLPSPCDPEYKPYILGVKIACGFEILVSQAKSTENDKIWLNYVKSLKEKNYFKGLLEGSKEYKELLEKAKNYYKDCRDSMQSAPKIGNEILELSRSEFNEESQLPDDDDRWLVISAEELDEMLEEKYGKDFNRFNNNSDPKDFTKNVVKFLENRSEIDGVEQPSNCGKKVTFSEELKDGKIKFDPDLFASAVQNMLNFAIPDDNWSTDSDMSDYADENESEGGGNKMEEYMKEMDRELAATSLGESFQLKNGDGFEDIESFKPVDIDVNALKNIMESYKSQLGEAGPSTSMLGPMGIHLDFVDPDKT